MYYVMTFTVEVRAVLYCYFTVNDRDRQYFHMFLKYIFEIQNTILYFNP